MRSEGQAWALEQLEEIVSASSESFEIMQVEEPEQIGDAIGLTVSVDCSRLTRTAGGLPLRARERLRIRVPWSFPLARPAVHFAHKRYAGFPHVQWGNSICLYQAPEVEWLPGHGMFGFMERVSEWLRAAAANELDPAGQPLHPPVTYPTSRLHVVPCIDAPKPEPPFWGGFVEVIREGEVAAELGRWSAYGECIPAGRLASAILLPTAMPHEYPLTMRDLIDAIAKRGVPLDLICRIVNLGALSTESGKPALFVLGAPMRGIAGGRTLQHLACWLVDPDQTRRLREAVLLTTPDDPKDLDAFCTWAVDARVEWCRVHEDRPEIVERRDSTSIARVWKEKHVAVLGCGAIGSTVAPMVARAGVTRLQLYDNDVVRPGVIVRQDFRRDRVGYTKSSAVRMAILGARPDLDVMAYHRDVSEAIGEPDALEHLMSADVIIDATASRVVATSLELHFRTHPKRHPPIVSMVVGHNGDIGLMTLASERHAGMSVDIDRRSKLALASSKEGQTFFQEFWPTDAQRRKPFQPEPGCSSPTFRGSYADVLSLAARMTNVAANWLLRDSPAPRTFAIDLSESGATNETARELEFAWRPHRVVQDGRHGYEIRITCEAFAAMLGWTRRSERLEGRRVETGGVLFGEADEFLKIVWIDEVSGPPHDSVSSPDGFLCGTAGVDKMNAEKSKRTTNSVAFMGMWHTHPLGLPSPSVTDLRAMEQLFRAADSYLSRRFVMIIVGGTSEHPLVSGSVFQRSEYGL